LSSLAILTIGIISTKIRTLPRPLYLATDSNLSRTPSVKFIKGPINHFIIYLLQTKMAYFQNKFVAALVYYLRVLMPIFCSFDRHLPTF
jgi:hypothetical protein